MSAKRLPMREERAPEEQPNRMAQTGPRSLDDRLAEGIRRSRIGLARPLWNDASDSLRDDYLESSRRLHILGKELGFSIRDEAA